MNTQSSLLTGYALSVQIDEKTKKVCVPDGYAPPLAAYEAEVPPSRTPIAALAPN